MSMSTAVSSIIELMVVLLLIYGFYKEDKVIAFEQKLKMIIVVNYRRYKRKKRLEEMRKTRDFKVIDGTGRNDAKAQNKSRSSIHVA